MKKNKAREWGDSAKAWLGGAFYMVVHVDLTNRWPIVETRSKSLIQLWVKGASCKGDYMRKDHRLKQVYYGLVTRQLMQLRARESAKGSRVWSQYRVSILGAHHIVPLQYFKSSGFLSWEDRKPPEFMSSEVKWCDFYVSCESPWLLCWE